MTQTDSTHTQTEPVAAERRDDTQLRDLRAQFLEITRSGSGFDLDAGQEVREHGWARDGIE